ncbi:zinc ribbon domain-containing protein [Acinetobacter junii]|uniref:Zinc ribbon domain-containing protein n=1 Tax=Acinetobacter junii TaxID=40215 RepID=A0AAX1MEX0_ACIJU|nr:zinc ribbon domain-containing protein [Acinetobacter junii]QUY35620.1 zinc ribbon domain-containing protein [Acinetobacter junii]
MALVNCKECGVQVSTQAKSCPSCGAKIKKPTSVFTWIILVIFIFGVFAAIGSGDNTGNSSSASGTPQLSPKEEALNNLEFNFEWSKDGFGNVMMIDMTIKNNGKSDIKDFTVVCEHTSNSGTKIDSNKREVFEIIKAGETRTFKEFNMGFIHTQATSSSCGVTDLVVI